MTSKNEASTGKSGGFDFGLSSFLTDDEGRARSSPLFFVQSISKTRCLHRHLSCKQEGSKRYGRGQRTLAKHSATVADKRRDHHFKLAHQLYDEYDVLCFEDLNLYAMERLWGRKMSDLGFAQFLNVLEWVAFKRGKQVVRIDRWYPSSQKCSQCGYLNTTLDRKWLCPNCGVHHKRDHNAAINIKTVGASTGYRSASKTRIDLRRRVDGRSLSRAMHDV